MKNKTFLSLQLLLLTMAFGCRNTPMVITEGHFLNATQIQCEESTDHYSFLSPKSMGSPTVQIGGPVGPGGTPVELLEYGNLVPYPSAVNQSGLISIAFTWGYFSPSPIEYNLVDRGEIYHVPSNATPIPYGDPICTLHPSQPTTGACMDQLTSSELGVINHYRSITYYTDGTAVGYGWGTVTPPGIGLGLPSAEISYFETTNDNKVKVTFDWIENNGQYGEIIQVQLYNETTGNIIDEVDHLYGNYINNGSTILDVITSNHFIDPAPYNGENIYHLKTDYWGNTETVRDERTYTLNAQNPNLLLPKAKITNINFNPQTLKSSIDLDIAAGDVSFGSIQAVIIKNVTANPNQALCTFTTGFADVSSCIDLAPVLNIQNEYKTITMYSNTYNVADHVQTFYHSPSYSPDDTDNSNNTGSEGSNSGAGSKDSVPLYVFEETNIRLAWEIADFANSDQISSISVGKLEGNLGFQLSEQLSSSVTETVDRFWKQDVSTQYLLNVTYANKQEKLYTCENITF